MSEEIKTPEVQPGEEKSLIVQKLEEAGLVAKGTLPILEGLENVSRSDIATPVYMLIQPSSEADSKLIGKFLDKGSGIPQDNIECVLLKLIKARNLWPKPFKRGDQRICWSKDSWKPAIDVPEPQAQICAQIGENGREETVCDQAAWGSEGPPACHLTYSFLAFDLRMNTPFIISFKGTSCKPVKQLINQFIRKQKNLWSAIVTIEAVKPDVGNWFTAQFAINWAESETELSNLKAIFDAAFAKNKQAAQESAEEAHTAETLGPDHDAVPF